MTGVKLRAYAILIVALSGCGGGSGDTPRADPVSGGSDLGGADPVGGDTPPAPIPPASIPPVSIPSAPPLPDDGTVVGGGTSGASTYRALALQANALEDKFVSEPFTLPADLPDTGSATYRGVLGIVADDIALGGQLELAVNFEASFGGIVGNVRNIVGSDEERYQGTLSIFFGVLDKEANPSLVPSFTATLRGNLTQGGDRYGVDGFIDGDFIGADHQAVEGEVVGLFATEAGNRIIDQGYFIGER